MYSHNQLLYQCTCPPPPSLREPCTQASNCTKHQKTVYGVCPACSSRPWPFIPPNEQPHTQQVLPSQPAQYRRDKVIDWLGQGSIDTHPIRQVASHSNGSSGGNAYVDAQKGYRPRGKHAAGAGVREKRMLTVEEMLNPVECKPVAKGRGQCSSGLSGVWGRV